MTRAAVVMIGDEVVSGETYDRNSCHISRVLTGSGVAVGYQCTIPNDRCRLETELRKLMAEYDLVIGTGGLGTTTDGVTRRAMAAALGRRLVLSGRALQMVKDHFGIKGREMPLLSYSQALLPKGATAIPNPKGAAPGVACEIEGTWLIVLPGVPSEMECTLEAALSLLARSGADRLRTRRIHTTGLTESEIQERLGGSLANSAVQIAFLPTVGGVDIILKEVGEEQSTLDALKDSEAVLQSRIGAYIYGKDGESLERVVGRVLQLKRMSLSVAESCTGGLIEHRITGVEGSSGYFLGGVVAYCNEVKEILLGVPHEVLIEHGAVSNEVARRMAAGVKELLRSDIGVSVTGIAGPSGAVPGKPVGLVYIGLAADATIECEERRFFGGRAEIKEQSAQAALDLLRRYLGGL